LKHPSLPVVLLPQINRQQTETHCTSRRDARIPHKDQESAEPSQSRTAEQNHLHYMLSPQIQRLKQSVSSRTTLSLERGEKKGSDEMRIGKN
jgi:hypothetical protein